MVKVDVGLIGHLMSLEGSYDHSHACSRRTDVLKNYIPWMHVFLGAINIICMTF